MIREKTQMRTTTVCAGDRRIRNMYVSMGHEVEIRVVVNGSSDEERFLLKYKGKLNTARS